MDIGGHKSKKRKIEKRVGTREREEQEQKRTKEENYLHLFKKKSTKLQTISLMGRGSTNNSSRVFMSSHTTMSVLWVEFTFFSRKCPPQHL